MGSRSGQAGLRVVTFESRRAEEIAELIRRHGGEPVSAPALREVPLSENGPALEFARLLREGKIDVAIFLTGVGTRFVAGAVASVIPKEELGGALRSVTTVARGPKPVAALREIGVTPSISVPEPNTWRELLAALDQHTQVAGKRVAVQEYGEELRVLLAILLNCDALSRDLGVLVQRREQLAPRVGFRHGDRRGHSDLAQGRDGLGPARHGRDGAQRAAKLLLGYHR